MSSTARLDDVGGRLGIAVSADIAARVNSIVGRIPSAHDEIDVACLLGMAARELGVGVAAFIGSVEARKGDPAYCVLLACKANWPDEYIGRGWCRDDPWLEHAKARTEPIRADDLRIDSPAQRAFVEIAAQCGFAHAFIVPVPPSPDRDRVGALYLGSDTPAAFDDGSVEARRPWARLIANEVHDWWCNRMRAELLEWSHLTAVEVDLLKRHAAGHCSKVIATALDTRVTTIDCRFQRVIAKLGVANRREAARLARLHAVI